MQNVKYPRLGEKVTYLKADEKGEVTNGEGIVQAVFLDPNRRVMVQVKDGEHAFNVDIFGINWTQATFNAYVDIIKNVVTVTEEGNELVKKTVSEYNEKVEALYNDAFGKPVEIEEQNDRPEETDEDGGQEEAHEAA